MFLNIYIYSRLHLSGKKKFNPHPSSEEYLIASVAILNKKISIEQIIICKIENIIPTVFINFGFLKKQASVRIIQNTNKN